MNLDNHQSDTTIMADITFRIHPALGISRVGNSSEYYLAPESSAGLGPENRITGGLPIKPGTESTTISDKDLRDRNGALKRQAQRFRIYSYETAQATGYPYRGQSEEITIGSSITIDGQQHTVADIIWTVHLANKKANCWVLEEELSAGQFSSKAGYDGGNLPDLRNLMFGINEPHDSPQGISPGNRQRLTKLVIDAGPRTIHGRMARRINFDCRTQPSCYKSKQGIQWLPNYPVSFPANHFRYLYSPSGTQVRQLGAIETDEHGRLIVLGGEGTATGWYQNENGDGNTTRTTFPLTDDVNNDGWFDDTADGPVSAVLVMKDGTHIEIENTAWVVSTDPAYAPQIRNISTVWDEVYDTWLHCFGLDPNLYKGRCDPTDASGYNVNYEPSFPDDIYPMFRSAHLNQFTTGLNKVAISAHARLNSLGPDAHPSEYLNVPSLIRSPYSKDNQFEIGSPRMPLALGDTNSSFLTVTRTQYFFLNQWFANKFGRDSHPALSAGEQLDKDVMTNLLGGRFSPGIDVTFIVRDPVLYNPDWKNPHVGPFRMHAATLDYSTARRDRPFLGIGYVPEREESRVEPGDICKFMALPWHTDYNSCATHLPSPNPGGDITSTTQIGLGWNTTLFWSWPAQRPVSVYALKDVLEHGGRLDAPQRYSVRGKGTQAQLGTDGNIYAASQVGRFQQRIDMIKRWQNIGIVIQSLAIENYPRGYDANVYLEVESRMSDVSNQVVPWPNQITDDVDEIEW